MLFSLTALQAAPPATFEAQPKERAPCSPKEKYTSRGKARQRRRRTPRPPCSGRASVAKQSLSLPFPSRPPSVRPRAPQPLLKQSPLPHPPSLPSGPQNRSRLPNGQPRPLYPPGDGQKGPLGSKLPCRDAIGPLPSHPASQESVRRVRRLPPCPVQLLHDSQPPPPRTGLVPGARRGAASWARPGPIRKGRGRPPATRSGAVGGTTPPLTGGGARGSGPLGGGRGLSPAPHPAIARAGGDGLRGFSREPELAVVSGTRGERYTVCVYTHLVD